MAEALEPWISQTRWLRVAVESRLPGVVSCTLLFVRDPEGWLCSLLGLDGATIRLTDTDALKIANVLGVRPSGGDVR